MNTSFPNPSRHHADYSSPLPASSTRTFGAQQIIDAITHAVTRTQRFQALQAAHRAFSHDNEDMHNYEIDLGAANALCLKLGYMLLQQDNTNSYNVHFYNEIEMACSCLKLVYGCSTKRRIQSFRNVGYSELVPLLLQMLNRTDILQVESRHATLQALHVLRVFTKLEMAKPCLISFPHLLPTLVQLVSSVALPQGTHWIVLPQDVEPIQLQIMGIFKDFVFRTSSEDKELVYHVDGLVPMLQHFATKPTTTTTTTTFRRVQEYVAAIWWNFALCPPIAINMATSTETLASLHNLMQPSNENKSLLTRRNALSAIGNLATMSSNQVHLLSFQNGILVQCLMETIQIEEEDTDSQRRAMRTLRCLVSDAAGHTLRTRIDFIQFLSSVAQTNVDRDTCVHAVECMAYIVNDEQAMEIVGDEIKTALIGTMEHSSESRLTLDACRPLSVCLSRENSTLTTFSNSVYSKLASAIEQSNDAVSHRAIATIVSSSNTNVPSPSFLHLLAALLSPAAGPDFEVSQSIAMTAIQTLARVENNKKALAEDERLLTALVNFAMSTAETEKKDQAKSLILELVPEL